MGNDQTLKKLEGVVETLMNKFQTLKQEKLELIAQVQAKEEKISELEGTLAAMTEDKSHISSRVATLLDSIEEWERTIDDDGGPEGAVQEQTEEKNSAGHKESQLFSVGE